MGRAARTSHYRFFVRFLLRAATSELTAQSIFISLLSLTMSVAKGGLKILTV